MTFWRSETMRERLPAEGLVEPYHEQNVKHGAYELGMGPEGFITSTADKVKKTLDNGQPLVIPPGQFALLLTEERVTVPLDSIAFISMKFGVKRRGLMNVSGFHVDPGFTGRLKFSVYNAGGSDITISRQDRVFLVWYANLDGVTEHKYKCNSEQDFITSDDQNVMHGEVASPAQLKSQMNDLKHTLDIMKILVTVMLSVMVSIGMMLWRSGTSSAVKTDQLKSEILRDVRDELSAYEIAGAGNVVPAAPTTENANE